jgi:hypothetical protein
MPNTQELRFRLSEQVKRGPPQRAFFEQELRAFLSTTTLLVLGAMRDSGLAGATIEDGDGSGKSAASTGGK